MLRSVLAMVLVVVAFVAPASALITGGKAEPMTDRGLPDGSLPLANLKTRIAWWEGPPFGGGQYHFEYSGATAELQTAIDLFAKLDSKRKQVVVKVGEQESFWLGISDKSVKHPIDWQYNVWVPSSWQRLRDAKAGLLPPGEEGDAPKTELVIFVTHRIDWKSLKIPDDLTVVDQRLESNGVAADQGAALQGRVLDSDGSLIVGATVTIGDDTKQTTGTSDAKGTFLVTRIPEGTHRIIVGGKGFASKDEYYHTFAKSTFKKLDVTLAKSVSARVRVVDQQNEPISGVEIRVSNCKDHDGEYYRVAGKQQFTSDGNGEFVMDDVPNGKIKFISRAKEYYYNSVLNEHDTSESPIVLKLLPTGTVKISVVSADGEPVTSKYMVEIAEAGVDRDQGSPIGSWGGSANIGADGTYTFENIPPGVYVISGRQNPGRAKDSADPAKVTITGQDRHDIKLIAK